MAVLGPIVERAPHLPTIDMAHFLQAPPLPARRHSSRGWALFPLHHEPARCRGFGCARADRLRVAPGRDGGSDRGQTQGHVWGCRPERRSPRRSGPRASEQSCSAEIAQKAAKEARFQTGENHHRRVAIVQGRHARTWLSRPTLPRSIAGEQPSASATTGTKDATVQVTGPSSTLRLNAQRHLISRKTMRTFRSAASAEWTIVSAAAA